MDLKPLNERQPRNALKAREGPGRPAGAALSVAPARFLSDGCRMQRARCCQPSGLTLLRRRRLPTPSHAHLTRIVWHPLRVTSRVPPPHHRHRRTALNPCLNRAGTQLRAPTPHTRTSCMIATCPTLGLGRTTGHSGILHPSSLREQNVRDPHRARRPATGIQASP